MKIREIRLKNFKRFTDTTISNIPAEARLILVAGPNGCGKSSLFDAINMWYRFRWVQVYSWDETYHRKQVAGATETWDQTVQVEFHDPQPLSDEERRKAIYVRSAYRNDPEFQLEQLARIGPAMAEQRISRMIDNDQVVSVNYRRLVSEGFEYVYEKGNPEETLLEFRERSIGQLRNTMYRLFPGLILNGLGNPLVSGTFRFDKGESKGFLYKNLSGGEKSAFDLLLDVIVKGREFTDTVFFIDEPEAHISTALQAALLQELFDAVPERSQLWIATHSIGMMRKARDLNRSNPGSVVFLDFDGLDFDMPVRIGPAQASRPFWKRAMQVALDDLAGYVAPEHVVLCEGGSNVGGADFDAVCYNLIFAAEFPDVFFIGAGSAEDVRNDPRKVGQLLRGIAPNVNVTRLIDRDERRDDEIEVLQEQGVRVLTLRNIESYLLHDSVLEAVCYSLGDEKKASILFEEKQKALASSVMAGGAADDMKRVAGDLYNATKRLFKNTKLGVDKRAFMSGVCAPQIKIGTEVYNQLRHDIFGLKLL